MFKYSILLVIMTATFISCTEDEEEIFVHEEIREYYNRFEAEAAMRNKQIDLDSLQIEGFIRSIITRSVVGQCQTNVDGSRTIIVDQNFWKDADDLRREFLIFHELGHCALDKDHNDNNFPDGTCISLMHSGNEDCRDNYNSLTRNEYLDELFKN